MKGETYRKAIEIEKQLKIAAECGYFRATAKQAAILAECYEETFGKALTRSQRTCGHCLKKAAVELYGDYMRYKNSPRGRKIDKEYEEGV